VKAPLEQVELLHQLTVTHTQMGECLMSLGELAAQRGVLFADRTEFAGQRVEALLFGQWARLHRVLHALVYSGAFVVCKLLVATGG